MYSCGIDTPGRRSLPSSGGIIKSQNPEQLTRYLARTRGARFPEQIKNEKKRLSFRGKDAFAGYKVL